MAAATIAAAPSAARLDNCVVRSTGPGLLQGRSATVPVLNNPRVRWVARSAISSVAVAITVFRRFGVGLRNARIDALDHAYELAPS